MEKPAYQEYRDNLANKLREIRKNEGGEEALRYLRKEKETQKYKEFLMIHQQEDIYHFPESFRPFLDGREFSGKDAESDPVAESWPDLVAKYSLFKEKVNPKADVVYHPCGANDVSPSVAFPDSRVIYVDLNEQHMNSLQNSGYEAHVDSALEFDPGDVDILIMLNPQIPPDVPSSYVVQNGFVLSNDYHGTASKLHENDQYKFSGIIRKNEKNEKEELIFDTENLEDCWYEVDTEEEFKNAPFSWGPVYYEIAESIVEEVTGKKENVLVEYKKIIDIAKEEQRKKDAKAIEKDPEMKDIIDGMNEVGVLVFYHNGKEHFLNTDFPKKKGAVDDIFVFKKTQEKKSDIL